MKVPEIIVINVNWIAPKDVSAVFYAFDCVKNRNAIVALLIPLLVQND